MNNKNNIEQKKEILQQIERKIEYLTHVIKILNQAPKENDDINLEITFTHEQIKSSIARWKTFSNDEMKHMCQNIARQNKISSDREYVQIENINEKKQNASDNKYRLLMLHQKITNELEDISKQFGKVTLSELKRKDILSEQSSENTLSEPKSENTLLERSSEDTLLE